MLRPLVSCHQCPRKPSQPQRRSVREQSTSEVCARSRGQAAQLRHGRGRCQAPVFTRPARLTRKKRLCSEDAGFNVKLAPAAGRTQLPMGTRKRTHRAPLWCQARSHRREFLSEEQHYLTSPSRAFLKNTGNICRATLCPALLLNDLQTRLLNFTQPLRAGAAPPLGHRMTNL